MARALEGTPCADRHCGGHRERQGEGEASSPFYKALDIVMCDGAIVLHHLDLTLARFGHM